MPQKAAENKPISSIKKIVPGKLVKLENGELYVIGEKRVTRPAKSAREGPRHFCTAIAVGTSYFGGEIIEEDVQCTIVEMWEEHNPDTGKTIVKMCENSGDLAVVEELLALEKGEKKAGFPCHLLTKQVE